jgi:hypothetical protein
MPHKAHNPNYGKALMSALPQAIGSNPHTSLLNVCIQIANKMGFQKKICFCRCICCHRIVFTKLLPSNSCLI